MGGLPDTTLNRHVLQFKLCTGLDLRQESLNRNWANYTCGDFHPVISFLIDPKLALHARQDLSSHVRWLVSGPGSSLQNVNRESFHPALADKLEVESTCELLHHLVIALPLFFVLGNTLLPLLR